MLLSSQPSDQPLFVRPRRDRDRVSRFAAVAEFVGTLGDRGSVPIERLAGPADLAAWLAGAGLESADVPVTPAALRRAIQRREAIARVVLRQHLSHAGRPSRASMVFDGTMRQSREGSSFS